MTMMTPFDKKIGTWFLAALLCVSSLACSGDDGETDEKGGSSSMNAGGSQADPSKPENMTMNDAMTTGDACMMADPDCANWFCRCEDGAVVNARFCDNGFCSGPGAICPDACVAFQHGAWTGYAGGGVKQEDPPKDGGSTPDMGGGGGTTDPPDDGPMCATSSANSNSTCDQCGRASCCEEIQRCEGSGACLDFWDCVVFGNVRQDCEDQYPDGIFDYEDLEYCLVSECSGECS